MATYKTAYIVTTNSNNEFVVKYSEQFENIHIDTWNISQDTTHYVDAVEFANLNGLVAILRELGVSCDVLLPVYISVLVMVGLDVYSIDVKE